MTNAAPLKWHGGKNAFHGKLAKWIISLMPKHTHYVEPYFGGGAVLLHKDPEGVSEVANDINHQLMNFWRVLGDPFQFPMMQVKLNTIPFSEDEYKTAVWEKDHEIFSVDAAVNFFIRARQSRQGLMKDFATLSKNRTRRGMNEQVSSWLTAIEGLDEVAERLKRVAILNRPAIEVIKQQDGPNTCFYLDPPYLMETRSCKTAYGADEMNDGNHAELLSVLAGIKGKFLLSGYRSNLYCTTAEKEGWTRHEFDIVNNASGRKKKQVKTECVWTNF